MDTPSCVSSEPLAESNPVEKEAIENIVSWKPQSNGSVLVSVKCADGSIRHTTLTISDDSNPLDEPVRQIRTGWQLGDGKGLHLFVLCKDGIVRILTLPNKPIY